MSKTHIKNTQTETAKVEAVKVFVVGQYCGPKTLWKIIGVFDTEKAAIAACSTPHHFIGPVDLNKIFYRADGETWPGCFYPNFAPVVPDA